MSEKENLEDKSLTKLELELKRLKELEKSKLEIEKLRTGNEKVKLAPNNTSITYNSFTDEPRQGRNVSRKLNNGTAKGGSMHDKQNMNNNEDIKAELTKITNKEEQNKMKQNFLRLNAIKMRHKMSWTR
ncbi:hypothetical protein RhiirA4_454760 [Rhizophagus irregularis]|uniref:Uncharacterized protein n=1 Tax=Rhizophagus irregularis TaxID=588596 RepID=A0A2I1G3R2_9GLOM|nr:hypothetical protein RhiirA4_454760 [Rhizophagus irregularis]